MFRWRRQLGRIAGAWLALQLAVLAVVPTALAASMPAAAGTTCACPHGSGGTSAVCPMHHGARNTEPACSCRSTADPAAAIVASLLGPTAVLVPVTGAAPLVAASRVNRSPSRSSIDADIVPDAPPPRA